MTIKYIPGSDVPYDMSLASARQEYNKAFAKHQRKVKAAKIEQDRIGTSKIVSRWKGRAAKTKVYYQGGGKWDTAKPKSKQSDGEFGGGGLSFGESLKIGQQVRGGKYKESNLNIPYTQKDKRPVLYGDDPNKFQLDAPYDAFGFKAKAKQEQKIKDTAINNKQKVELSAAEKAIKEAGRVENGRKTGNNPFSSTEAKNNSDTLTEIKELAKEPLKTNVHTRHYLTGERLGVMTKEQRDKYEKEAGQKTFESEMNRHQLAIDDPRRETKYTSKRWRTENEKRLSELKIENEEKGDKLDLSGEMFKK